jgi:serine/threonine-protein kinase
MSDPARIGALSGAGPLAPGTLVGNRFRVKAHLRTEAETELYRASDAQSGDDVALRVMRPSGPVRAVLERELAKAQRLGPHKNVAAVVAVIREGDQLVVAQEWPDGHTLREVIDAQRKQGTTVDPARAHTLLGHVAAGLEHVYGQLVHGGLHPGNIWLTSSGRIRVADLALLPALAGLARGGAPAGAPAGVYLAPEVARGGAAMPASDVYALGAILFELLTGAPPVPPLQPPSRTVPGIPPAVDAVVGRALLPNPAGRYPAPSEMLKALEAAVGSPAAAGSGPTAAAAPQAGAAAAATAGRPFDVSAAAGLSQEEARWLVQKDRLDFGPFSLQQVKAQIEQGVFRGENLIVDMDSGARQKIMDHPQLGDFARSSERRQEHARRVQAEHVHEKVERKKYKAFVLIIGAAVVIVGAGLGLFLMNRRAAQESALASRAGEADIDEFLKGVKVDFPSSKRPTARRAGRGSGSKGDPFNSATNLGDVSQGKDEAILSDRVIQTVMMGNYRKLVPCIMDERRRSPGLSDMDLEFIVTGSGKVSAVKVNGQQQGPFASCVLGRMQSFNFPKYDGSKTIASWSMAVR